MADKLMTKTVFSKFITDYYKPALNAKQNTLSFDTTPTAGSTKPVTSGGIKTALDGKANSSHTHAIADVSGLQTALDGKVAKADIDAVKSVFTGMMMYCVCKKDSDGTAIPPSGFLILDNSFSITRANYTALFAILEGAGVVGEASSTDKVFKYGANNDNIIAPDVEGRYLRIGNNADSGNLVSAGLPNITGSVKGRMEAGMEVYEGAFYKISGTSSWRIRCEGIASYFYGFDASKSNSLYGASPTVTPASVSLNLIIGY